jgi:hypothetical protein
MSGKSLTMAWLRTLLGLSAIVAFMKGMGVLARGPDDARALAPPAVMVASLVALVATKQWTWLTHARAARAIQLAALVGVDPATLEQPRHLGTPGPGTRAG